MINPQIANPQISTKYCTTLSQKSPKRFLCKRFISVQIWIRDLYAIRTKGMNLRTFWSFKSANHNKHWDRKPQTSANVTNYLSPQFAICGTYLWTSHLCKCKGNCASECTASEKKDRGNFHSTAWVYTCTVISMTRWCQSQLLPRRGKIKPKATLANGRCVSNSMASSSLVWLTLMTLQRRSRWSNNTAIADNFPSSSGFFTGYRDL